MSLSATRTRARMEAAREDAAGQLLGWEAIVTAAAFVRLAMIRLMLRRLAASS